MKRLPFFLAFFILRSFCFGQYGEFRIHPNGLIYSDRTMEQLRLIVDSLNLEFRTCDLDRIYYSKYQAKAHFISLEGGDIQEAKKDMENNTPFDDFVKKYSKSTVDKDLLVVKFEYRNYEDKDIVGFKSVVEEHGIRIEGRQELYVKPVKGTWVFDYREGSNYSDESIRGFYFMTEFEKYPLPEVYARMVQYADCMVDTSTQIFRENEEKSGLRHNSNKSGKVTLFMDYVHRETNMPEYNGKKRKRYWRAYRAWNLSRISHIDSTISKQEEFQNLLEAAVAEALEEGGSTDEFEEYVGRYYSKKAELELKRGRVVFGSCSMDDRPRIHAMNIAILAAETGSWEIFLRAHLNIMNDRFERISDGSYAWAGRKTYIKELEELGINVTDLLLGISLQIENPSQNHYYGNIRRLGRALSETKYAEEVEAAMLNMIEDDELDDYNRIAIYYLFLNYAHHVEDESRKEQSLARLKKSVVTLPDYLKRRINVE